MKHKHHFLRISMQRVIDAYGESARRDYEHLGCPQDHVYVDLMRMRNHLREYEEKPLSPRQLKGVARRTTAGLAGAI